MESSDLDRPILHWGAFLWALIAPLILWGVMMAAPLLAGQPGVVCLTPAAWLLAFWSGGAYIRFSDGRPGRWPLLGPALVGAGLGLCQGLAFVLITSLALPPGSDPGEATKAIILDAIVVLAGLLVCAVFSIMTAWLTLRRMANQSWQ